ncbi:MAG: PilZ domain-containing protein [Candidatus Omnitrophica bacterium]|nr:PilZ domain-containing protein [Candidatus Omnitrophota bacterium]
MILSSSVRERRRFVRVSSGCPVQIKQVPDSSPIRIHNSMLADISEGGLQLFSFYFYPVRCKFMVEVFLSPITESLKTLAKVVWIEQMPFQERYRVGIEFSNLNEAGRSSLRQMIGQSANS